MRLQEEQALWLTHLNDLQGHNRVKVRPFGAQLQPAAGAAGPLGALWGRPLRRTCPTALFLFPPQVVPKLFRTPGNQSLKLYLYQIFSKDSPSYSVITGTWKRANSDGEASGGL